MTTITKEIALLKENIKLLKEARQLISEVKAQLIELDADLHNHYLRKDEVPMKYTIYHNPSKKLAKAIKDGLEL